MNTVTIRNLLLAWALSTLVGACNSNWNGQQEEKFDGTDMKKEFLKDHNGEYSFTSDYSGYVNFKTLKLNENETYELKFENHRIVPGDDSLGRTAECSGIRRGKILRIQKMDAEVTSLTTGYTTFNFGPAHHLDGYIQLGEGKTEITSGKTVKYNPNTQKDEPLPAKFEFTESQYVKICGYNYTEIIHLERILPEALVIASLRSSEKPISQRFMTKDPNAWVWTTGKLAQDLANEGSDRMGGVDIVRAFESQPESLTWPNRRFEMKGKIEIDSTDILNFSLGTNVLEQFYPMVTVQGEFTGASYRPKTKDLVLHLANPISVNVPARQGNFWDLDSNIQSLLQAEAARFSDIRDSITKVERQSLQIGINVDGTRTVKFFDGETK